MHISKTARTFSIAGESCSLNLIWPLVRVKVGRQGFLHHKVIPEQSLTEKTVGEVALVQRAVASVKRRAGTKASYGLWYGGKSRRDKEEVV